MTAAATESWSSAPTPEWHEHEIRVGINRYARDRKQWPEHEDTLAFILDQWLRSITDRSEQYDEAHAWPAGGGYSPSGNSWVCPREDCGWGISGLNAPVDEDDPYWEPDPVAEHLAEHDRTDREEPES